MSDQTPPRRSRRGAVAIVVVLVLVIAGVTGIAIATAGGGGAPGAAGSTTPGATLGAAGTVTPSATPSADTSKPPAVLKPTTTASPTPQPTKTATISEPTAVPIKKELTATVVKMAAVTGVADGPGEIGGPSVRFTIRITNTTGKTFSLSSTVVNAYYGSASTPAVQLRKPGAKDFPTSVKDGASATGVYVFNIPKADRGKVEITVDTSVQNPVVAFKGSAPRS